MPTTVRYVVDSTDDLEVYELLGFEVVMHPTPGFAMLGRGDTRLALNVPGGGGGAGQDAGGRRPEPGGWTRVQVDVEELDPVVERLVSAGIPMRGNVIEGRGGRQVIVEDASGNAIEVFQPYRN